MAKEKKFTYEVPTDKEIKNLAILNLISKKGPLSRTDISKITNIHIVSISNYVNSFIKKDLLIEGGFDESSGGRRPELLELNKKAGLVIGVSVENLRIEGILADLGLGSAGKKSSVAPDNKRDSMEGALSALIDGLIKAKGGSLSIKAIGIGFAPGGGEAFINIGDAIEKKFDIPAFAGEDYICAGAAEKDLNPAISEDKFLFMYSDLGAGVYFEKDNFRASPPVEERGSTKDEKRFYYLRPWPTSLSAARFAKKAAQSGIGTSIVELANGDINKINLGLVIEAAKIGDDLARDILEQSAITLGVRVAYLSNIFDIDTVVIGGGPENSDDIFMKSLRESAAKLVRQNIREKLKIIPGAAGRDSVAIGAAALAVREIFIGA